MAKYVLPTDYNYRLAVAHKTYSRFVEDIFTDRNKGKSNNDEKWATVMAMRLILKSLNRYKVGYEYNCLTEKQALYLFEKLSSLAGNGDCAVDKIPADENFLIDPQGRYIVDPQDGGKIISLYN